MKKDMIIRNTSFLCSAFLVLSAASLEAQTTSVQEVPGINGTSTPSASSILTPHVTSGRFGTSLQGTYLSPSSEDGLFSSNIVRTPSGAFVGVMSDADKERMQGEMNFYDEGISERDQLLLLRQYRNQAKSESETAGIQQRSAQQPVISEQPEIVQSVPEPIQNISPAAPMPQQEPEQTAPSSEEIWMRGSSRRRAPQPISQEVYSGLISQSTAEIDPNWYGYGVQNTELEQEEAAPQEPRWSDETGGVIGGTFTLPSAVPAASTPSESLARNGRREIRQIRRTEEQLETALLQSPVVNPLAPIQVSLQGTTAVVTGVVPNETAKIEAGKVLLNNSGVESVDNRLIVSGE